MYVYVYIYVYMYICIYIYICIDVYMHMLDRLYTYKDSRT